MRMRQCPTAIKCLDPTSRPRRPRLFHRALTLLSAFGSIKNSDRIQCGGSFGSWRIGGEYIRTQSQDDHTCWSLTWAPLPIITLSLLWSQFWRNLSLYSLRFGNVKTSDGKDRKEYRPTQGKVGSWDILFGKQLIDQRLRLCLNCRVLYVPCPPYTHSSCANRLCIPRAPRVTRLLIRTSEGVWFDVAEIWELKHNDNGDHWWITVAHVPSR